MFDDLVRRRWLYLGLIVTLAIWCFVDVMPRGSINVKRIFEHRTDFTVYTEAGAAFFDGRDPYQVSNPRGWHYLYPPLFAILVSPLHALPTTTQVAVWFALNVLMLLGCYHETRQLISLFSCAAWANSQRESRRLAVIGLAGLLAALLPLLNSMQRGQVEVLKLYLLLLGLRMAVSARGRRGWYFAGIVLALPSVMKLTPVLPVACLILFEAVRAWNKPGRGGWRRPTTLGAGFASGLLLFALVIPSLFVGWNANLRHLESWFARVAMKAVDVRSSDFGEDVRTVRNQSLDNAAYRLGNWIMYTFAAGPDDAVIDGPHDPFVKLPMDVAGAGELIVLSRLAALAVLFVFVIRTASSSHAAAQGAVFGLACVATLIICPVSRGCYFALFLPALVFQAIWLLQSGSPRIALFSALVPVAMIWLYYLLLPFSGRIGLLGMSTAIWFAAVCVMSGRLLAQEKTAVDADLTGHPPRDRKRELTWRAAAG